MRERAETALEDPQARLETALMDEFLQTRGCTLSTVGQKPLVERQALLAQATHTRSAGSPRSMRARPTFSRSTAVARRAEPVLTVECPDIS